MEHENAPGKEAGTRPPTIEDLKAICTHLNAAGAKYALIGGLAVNYYGFPRATQDIDFLVDSSEENIVKIKQALDFLPEGASRDLRPDDVLVYSIVRVADEIVIDLIGSVGDVDFNAIGIERGFIDGVPVPIADLDTLIKTKQGLREKDKIDLQFLLMLKAERGTNPEVS